MQHPIRALFDGISSRYDGMNHLLTAGRDHGWRHKACALPKEDPGSRILDLCGGTGDLSIAWKERFPASHPVVADFSVQMLSRVAEKSAGTYCIQADSLRLPFQDGCADAVLCGYGMRNLDSLEDGLAEIARVLRPGGSFLTLEFFRPTNPWTKFFYGVLGPLVVPLVGAMVARDHAAYQYLVDSIRSFRSVQEYGKAAAWAGLKVRRILPLDGGVSHAVWCCKEG